MALSPTTERTEDPYRDYLAPEYLILGRSPAMSGIRQRLAQVAAADVPVLIRGESGTGKEVFGKLIHRRSARSQRTFVKIACPSLPSTLMESELFGYERGAFTGAYATKAGLVEMAHMGTLFFDEIAELDTVLQAKLLQLLQDGEFCRLGGSEPRHIETRILCSTSHPLEKDIQSGAFRADLYYRINVVSIDMPPLRERREDIPELARYFFERYNRCYHSNAAPPSSRLLEILLRYDWPGNIRELDNLMKRYVILDSEDAIVREVGGADAIGRDEIMRGSKPTSLKKLTRLAIRELERKIILQALEANNWNRKETARSLDISYRGLFYKIKQVGAPPKKALLWPVAPEVAVESPPANAPPRRDGGAED